VCRKRGRVPGRKENGVRGGGGWGAALKFAGTALAGGKIHRSKGTTGKGEQEGPIQRRIGVNGPRLHRVERGRGAKGPDQGGNLEGKGESRRRTCLAVVCGAGKERSKAIMVGC